MHIFTHRSADWVVARCAPVCRRCMFVHVQYAQECMCTPIISIGSSRGLFKDALTQYQRWPVFRLFFLFWPLSCLWFLLLSWLSPHLILGPALYYCLLVPDLDSACDFVLHFPLVADPGFLFNFATVSKYVSPTYCQLWTPVQPARAIYAYPCHLPLESLVDLAILNLWPTQSSSLTSAGSPHGSADLQFKLLQSTSFGTCVSSSPLALSVPYPVVFE